MATDATGDPGSPARPGADREPRPARTWTCSGTTGEATLPGYAAAVALRAKVLVVSDSVATGAAEDRSGPALAAALEAAGFAVVDRLIVPDGVEPVARALRQMAAGFGGLVVTTGGTGFSPRDLTPEATRSVVERLAPGIAEAVRLADRKGRLSRGVAGTLGRCLVVNVPGSPTGAADGLAAVLDVVPHALALLAGDDPHPHGENAHGPGTGGRHADGPHPDGPHAHGQAAEG